MTIATGAPGGGSHCAPSGCIFDDRYCVNKYGQCGILESEVAQKCGAWDKCDGVVCKAGYGGYCLARETISDHALSDMWGYKKVGGSSRAEGRRRRRGVADAAEAEADHEEHALEERDPGPRRG